MAVPVIESSNTATGQTVTSIVITKPTGLAVDDLMVAKIALYDWLDDNRTLSTPAGWTLAANSTTGTSTRLVRIADFYKVADSGDTAASDFTFSASGAVGFMSGYLARISGYS
ncbi:hypothetical protein KAU11_12750, partial [Candidatus Babeliales bacterium]|nr:hypothetical protein [Candidatus Babeliales bacterium]